MRYGRKLILAVDDAAFTLSRITDALGKHYEMVTVNSGSRALKYLDRNKPDLILLDIRMPIKNGFELLRDIRDMEDRADIPVIMLTAMEDKQSVMKGIELGICDYVLKPFAPDDLLERVQRILDPKGGGWTPPALAGGESGSAAEAGHASGGGDESADNEDDEDEDDEDDDDEDDEDDDDEDDEDEDDEDEDEDDEDSEDGGTDSGEGAAESDSE